MSNMILVTGATGHVGGLVAALLSDRNVPIRLLLRDRAKAPLVLGAETFVGDYGDTGSLEHAFAGIDTAYLVSASAPPGERAKLHANAFAVAARVGVRHVVYLSLQGSAPDSQYPFSRDHWESEQSLRATGLAFTILRNGKYTEQLLEPDMIDDTGVLHGPAGDGRVAWISRADSARVIAAILPSPPGGIVGYTGPEALTLTETATRLSVALGRNITFRTETADAAYELARARAEVSGAPSWRADLSAGTNRAIAAGEYATVDDAAGWIGRSETLEDTVASGALDGLRR